MRIVVCICMVFFLTACVSSPPDNTDNICSIFKQKSRWYKAAKRSEKKYAIPISVNMAFMLQESGYRSKVRPPRGKFLWVLPGKRKSSSYGYSQAKKDTWKWYKKSTGRSGAKRHHYADAIDFMGWYNQITVKKYKVNLRDAKNLYFAYHEGHGGYAKKTFQQKAWLLKVANKVQKNARRYQEQLVGCEKSLAKKGFWFF